LIYFGGEAMYLTEGKQVEISCRNQPSNFQCIVVKLPAALILSSLESLDYFFSVWSSWILVMM